MRNQRIGTVSSDTEIFLRRLREGLIDKDINYIILTTKKTANKILSYMYLNYMRKINLKIITIPQKVYAFTDFMYHALNHEKFLLEKFGFFEIMSTGNNEYNLYSFFEPILKFNKTQEKKGKKLLKKMNVDSWFVSFHARDPAYLSSRKLSAGSSRNYRDCDIDNFLKAADYITKKGGYALRLGAVVGKEIEIKNPKIIDYSKEYRSPFGDIYLSSKCKFFLGSTAGLVLVPIIFNVPTIVTNLIPYQFPPFRKGDMYILKKIWSKKKKRYLTFDECINSEIFDYCDGDLYDKHGLIVEENTPEEIYEVAKEMNERLDGTWKETKEDEELQKKFKSLFKTDNPCFGCPARLGSKFLRDNKHLIK